jgi:protease I
MPTPTNVQTLSGITVAILVTDGFEQSEMTEPRDALEKAGANTRLVSDKAGSVQAFKHDSKGDQFPVDLSFEDAYAQDFDAVLLPGGAFNADRIRSMPAAQRIVQEAEQDGKPIAVICHGAWLLVSAGLVRGRTLTSWPSLQDDIRNAGGNWVDQEVAVDKNWISSRKPDDIPAFTRELLGVLGQRVALSMHARRGEPPRVGPSS